MTHRRRGRYLANSITVAILLMGLVVVLLPFLWIFSTAFKTQVDAMAMPPLITFQPTFENLGIPDRGIPEVRDEFDHHHHGRDDARLGAGRAGRVRARELRQSTQRQVPGSLDAGDIHRARHRVHRAAVPAVQSTGTGQYAPGNHPGLPDRAHPVHRLDEQELLPGCPGRTRGRGPRRWLFAFAGVPQGHPPRLDHRHLDRRGAGGDLRVGGVLRNARSSAGPTPTR